MICKYCKKEIESDSVFCRFCGERVQRAKRKPKEEVKVAPPTVTSSGKYRGRVMVNGERVWITEDTEAAFYIRARAVKTGMIEQAKALPRDTLGDLIDRYLADNAAVLSPSTVQSYTSMRDNAFPTYISQSVATIPWQRMISEETERCGAKTLENRWRLVTAAMRYAKMQPPNVTLPKKVRSERDFLDYEQIQTFIEAIRGDDCELAYLLALHSLRLSEIQALTPAGCEGGTLRVRGAVVRGPSGYVRKELNKTDLSRRDVPVMIPRLSELLGALPVAQRDTTLNRHLRQICAASGLPEISLHCLRHSFASLAYHLRWTIKSTMQVGGWSAPDVVQSIYTHLAAQDISEDVERMRAFYSGAPLTVSKSVSKMDG